MINSVEVGEKDTNVAIYPKLMVNSKGLVVLMSNYNVGCVVREDSTYSNGYSSERWDMNEFRDYNGTIELSNKV